MTTKTAPENQRNKLCSNCVRSCKQAAHALVLDCPRYLPPPFKVKTHRYDQLDLFSGKKAQEG